MWVAGSQCFYGASIQPLLHARNEVRVVSAWPLPAGLTPTVTHSGPVPVSDVGPHSHLPHDLEDVRRMGGSSICLPIVVHWCGHGQEVLPTPGEGKTCDLVPVIGETW